MAKLMYVVPPAMGHYSPIRNGALKLAEKGHEVLYVTSAPFKQVPDSDGFAFRCYQDDPVISEFGSVEEATRWACETMASRGIFALARVAKKLFVDSAREKAKELGPFVDRYRPDVLVADLFSLEVPLVCEGRGIPWATHCWSLVPVNCRELPVLSTGQPFPFQALSESLPKVYVSLGTVFSSREGFFEAVVEALRREPVQVVLALGNSVFGESEAARLPSHWIAQEFVPQSAILGSVDAMITHGGSNTVTDGLSAGVPMTVCPMNADNYDLAQRVAELKIGLRLPERALADPHVLRDAVRRVLSDGEFRRRSREVSEVYRRPNGSAKSAEILELLSERRHPIYRDSSLSSLEEGSGS